MRRAIATVSLSGTLREKLEAAASARFDAVELFEPDFIGYRGGGREVKRIAADLGLGIDLYQPFRDFEGMPPAAFARNLLRAERKFNLMGELGAPLLLVCSNTSRESLPNPDRAAEQLAALAERAAARGLRVGFEALAWGRFVRTYGLAWDIVRRAGHPQLGLILDSFHTLSLGDDPSGIRQIPGDRIFFVQMADAPLLAMDVLQWARHHRNFPGQGQLDVTAFFEHVLVAGYTGTLSLEVFNDVFRATPNRRTALDAMRSLLFLEDETRRLLATHDTGDAGEARPHVTVPLVALPAMPKLEGYAFLEFGADEGAAAALGAFLARLGFIRFGAHQSKAVELYRQGDICLVVNAQPESPARARFQVEGVTVCCFGLSTGNPAGLAARAARLLSAPSESPRGAQDLVLPAIVAPGGTIVQFVPLGQTVEADFVEEARAPGVCTAGLTSIDHVAMGLAPDRFDTWVLFTRSVLGLERGERLDVADPFGLVQSCGIADPGRRLRLVLNVSLGDQTETARRVSAAGPSGGNVQHIAFGCADIFATVAALRARGTRFVPVSANYYDDLAARGALEPPVIDRLRALDVLYDADGGGTFFHAYTESFAGRFFAEVVQRNGYDGYGATNAPQRMAALHQLRDEGPT